MGSEGDVFFERVIAIVFDSLVVGLVGAFVGALTAGLSSTGIRSLVAIGATVNSVVTWARTRSSPASTRIRQEPDPAGGAVRRAGTTAAGPRPGNCRNV